MCTRLYNKRCIYWRHWQQFKTILLTSYYIKCKTAQVAEFEDFFARKSTIRIASCIKKSAPSAYSFGSPCWQISSEAISVLPLISRNAFNGHPNMKMRLRTASGAVSSHYSEKMNVTWHGTWHAATGRKLQLEAYICFNFATCMWACARIVCH